MVLFAEMSDGVIGVLVTLSGLFGGAVTWLATYLSGIRKERRQLEVERRKEAKEDEAEVRKIEKEREKTITQHLETVNQRITTENTELRIEARETQATLRTVLAHLKYLEGLLEAKNITFRPLDLAVLLSGSDTHRPISQPRKPTGGNGT